MAAAVRRRVWGWAAVRVWAGGGVPAPASGTRGRRTGRARRGQGSGSSGGLRSTVRASGCKKREASPACRARSRVTPLLLWNRPRGRVRGGFPPCTSGFLAGRSGKKAGRTGGNHFLRDVRLGVVVALLRFHGLQGVGPLEPAAEVD